MRLDCGASSGKELITLHHLNHSILLWFLVLTAQWLVVCGVLCGLLLFAFNFCFHFIFILLRYCLSFALRLLIYLFYFFGTFYCLRTRHSYPVQSGYVLEQRNYAICLSHEYRVFLGRNKIKMNVREKQGKHWNVANHSHGQL